MFLRLLILLLVVGAAFRLEAASANDHFADREVLAGAEVEFAGTLREATREPGEPDLFWYFPNGSVWWSWTAPISGFALLSMPPPVFLGGSREQAIVLVRRGESVAEFFSNPTIAQMPRFPGAYAAFNAVAGETYILCFIGPTEDPTTFRFKIQASIGPPILTQPVSQSVEAGGSALLRVQAPQAALYRTRWFRNGQPFASGGLVALNNVSAADAGEYQARVETMEGVFWTLSEMITVTVGPAWPPPTLQIAAIENNADEILLRIDGGPLNHKFFVLASPDLTNAWPVGPNYDPYVAPGEWLRLRRSEVRTPSPDFAIFKARSLGDTRAACVTNLRRIEIAKEELMIQYGIWNPFPDSAVRDYFRYTSSLLLCPENGTYSFNRGGVAPTCSVPGHEL